MAVWGTLSPWGLTTWSAGGAIASLPPTVSTSGLEAQNEALGVDIFFSGDFDVTAAGDYGIVSGFAALNQGLYHRIITIPGDYVLRPGYGVGIQRWVKRANKRSDLHELEQTMTDQLSFDRRVSRVKRVIVAPLDGEAGIRLGFEIEAMSATLTFQPLAFTNRGALTVNA